MNRNKFLNVLKWVWILAVIVGAGWYLFDHFQEISEYLNSMSVFRLMVSFILMLIGKLVISDFTRLSLNQVAWPTSYADALSVTAVTQLGKYLPGGIWHFAGKFGVYKFRGLSIKDATKAMILENLWLFSSAAVVGVFALLYSSGDLACKFLGLLCSRHYQLIAAIGLPIIWIAALLGLERLFYKQVKIQANDFVQVILEQILVWVLFGVSLWFVFPPGGGFLLQIIGAFSISWIAGYAAFFAPGGIGIREVFLAVLLGTFFSGEVVATYAAIHRLLWVLVEILLGAGSALLFGMPISKKEGVKPRS